MRKLIFILTIVSLWLVTATKWQVVQGQKLAADKIKAVEQMIAAKMARDHIPGLSLAIVVDGQLVWSNGYGMADVENSVSAKATTVYRSASIGKTITATAVMQLAASGKLELDAPVQKYCRALPTKRWPVTARQLLAHLGGIRHYGGPNNEQELFSTRHYRNVTEALDPFKDDPLQHEPGTVYLYSSYGYNLLGCVIEGASSRSFMDYLRQSVFLPAGMHATRDDDAFALIPQRASGYWLTEQGELRRARLVDMSNRLPAGGFVTTAEDLARFAAALMSGKLVSQAILEQMLTPQKTKDGKIVSYGLGWGLSPGEDWYGEKEAFHGGMTPQVSGMLYLLPGRRFAVAFLMNLEGVPERTELAAQIAKVVLELNKAK
jgi:CubicO group peptidase (beta-lactamase class C family)